MTGRDNSKRSKTSEEPHRSGSCFMSELSVAPTVHAKLWATCTMLIMCFSCKVPYAHASDKHFSSFATREGPGASAGEVLLSSASSEGNGEFGMGPSIPEAKRAIMPERPDCLCSWVWASPKRRYALAIQLTMLPTCDVLDS